MYTYRHPIILKASYSYHKNIMKIYTRTGDEGTTALFGGTRVPKHNLRIDSYGTVDELNSWMGLIRDQKICSHTTKMINVIQHHLFTVGAILATPPEKEDFSTIRHAHTTTDTDPDTDTASDASRPPTGTNPPPTTNAPIYDHVVRPSTRSRLPTPSYATNPSHPTTRHTPHTDHQQNPTSHRPPPKTTHHPPRTTPSHHSHHSHHSPLTNYHASHINAARPIAREHPLPLPLIHIPQPTTPH